MTESFKDRLDQSLEDTRSFPLDACLRQLFPDYLSCRATTERLDREGADLEIILESGTRYADLKFRDEDPRLWGADDLAVELYSVLEKRIRGYRNRKADFIIWLFKPTRRAVMVPFGPFKRCYEANWDYWRFWRGEPPQRTRMPSGEVYRSVHCYVPYSLFSAGATEACAAPLPGGSAGRN